MLEIHLIATGFYIFKPQQMCIARGHIEICDIHFPVNIYLHLILSQLVTGSARVKDQLPRMTNNLKPTLHIILSQKVEIVDYPGLISGKSHK